MQIAAKPRYPSPGEKVELTASTQAVETAGATITWNVNGEMVQQSRGGTRYTYTAGPVGSVANITVSIAGSNGRTVGASLTQRVHDVVVVWEGDTYVPPLYGGRSLHSPGSNVRLYAIPFVTRDDGTRYDSDDLIFHWAYGGGSKAFESGAGLRAVTATNNEAYTPLKISLFIKNLAGETLTIEHVEVPVVAPEIVFYASDPLMGLQLQRSLRDNFALVGAEQSVYAEPYHMIAPTRNDPSLSYEWQVSGQTLTTPGSLVLRPEGIGAGTARIDLTVRNNEYWQQRVGGRLSLRFNASEGGAPQSQETTPL
jgi:hypothetical protein